VRELRQVMPTVPIVFTMIYEPVAQRFVEVSRIRAAMPPASQRWRPLSAFRVATERILSPKRLLLYCLHEKIVFEDRMIYSTNFDKQVF
jgi:hypothetical protein